MLGEHAGFYELTAGEQTVSFAASLLDASESAIAPQDPPQVDGKVPGPPEGFHIGVRREIWIYLLLAVALLTALEWATYHRRLTV
jgi:hypothetical protein